MRNEAQTRFELIDPILIDHCGWHRQDIRVEQTAAQIDIVAGKGYRRPAGRTDYLLFRALSEDSEPIPLAIIEAKHEGLPPEHGLQQGKRYQRGKLHHVPFVFSSNGHQFVEYNEKSGITSEAVPMSEFPTPDELMQRYFAARDLKTDSPALAMLTTRYAKGREFLRCYQDAAIRAAIVIDECHRSAWGDWHAILENNGDAMQIGLTATPRATANNCSEARGSRKTSGSIIARSIFA